MQKGIGTIHVLVILIFFILLVLIYSYINNAWLRRCAVYTNVQNLSMPHEFCFWIWEDSSNIAVPF